MAVSATRYTALAIVLHWAIAGAIVLMIALGLWMHELAERGAVSDGLFRAYQLHKSIGLTILALSVARLAWRLFNPPPALPAGMRAWERAAATATHWLFYVLMIGLPLSGWVFVSAGWSLHDEAPLAITTRWFGLFEVPHLFGLNAASESTRAGVAAAAFRAHALMSWTMLGLLALHVGAALKHHIVDKDGVLARMIPGLPSPDAPPPRNPLRLALLGGGLSLTVVALAVAGLSWSDMAGNAQAADVPAPAIALETLTPRAARSAGPSPTPRVTPRNASAAGSHNGPRISSSTRTI
jgi:cytochrome b561